MLGSQFNALDTSTSYSTPYLLQTESTFEDPVREALIQESRPSQNNGNDEIILNPEAISKLEETNENTGGNNISQVGPDGQEYTEEEEEEIEKLKERDREVRRHEQAHFQAAGNYASPPKYEYQTGPDGKRYAVGGSVQIDLSEITNDPEATLSKARVIKRAALAPEEPSAQDRKVAREADQMAAQAQKDINEQRMNSTRALVNGEPVIQSPQSTQSIESPEEISAPDSIQSASETLESSAGKISGAGVSQYKTSRLEMSSNEVYRVERLATPRKTELYSPSLLSLDMYA